MRSCTKPRKQADRLSSARNEVKVRRFVGQIRDFGATERQVDVRYCRAPSGGKPKLSRNDSVSSVARASARL